jgi:predicted permease
MLSDLRYAFRQLAKSPGFALIAVLSLAIGIGSTTAVFSLVNAVLLRPLPAAKPEELRLLRWSGDDVRMTSFAGRGTETGSHYSNADCFNYPTFQALRDAAKDQADVFGFEPRDRIIFRLGTETGFSRGLMVSDNFFSLLGVHPHGGHLWNPRDSFSAGPLEVVVSYEWWQRQLGGRADAVGQIISLEGQNYTVIGILPAGFIGTQPGHPADLYLPMTVGAPLLYKPDLGRFHWFVSVMARVHSGVRDTQLKAVFDTVFAREVALARDGGIMTNPAIELMSGRHGADWDRERSGQQLLLLLSVAGFVLLVSCANLAGLSLARNAYRAHELAVRAALGASRSRLFRLPLIENAVLALAGGGLGVLLTIWSNYLIPQIVFGVDHNQAYNNSLDLGVLCFGLGVSLATALLTGLMPGWRASRSNPVEGLVSRGVVGPPHLRAGRSLAILQISLAMVLVISSGLTVRTALNLAKIDAGFSTERLLLVDISLRTSRQAMQDRTGFHQRLQEEISTLPGVQSASFVGFALLGGGSWTGGFEIAGREADPGWQVCRLNVGDRFFATLGVPILQGRSIAPGDDENAPKVVVVNERFIQRFLNGENPLGQTIRMLGGAFQIVGVSRDIKYNDLRQEVRPTIYMPFRQMQISPSLASHFNVGTYAIRTTQAPETSATAVRQLITRIDPDAVITGITTQENLRARGISRERMTAELSAVLASITFP